jgi:biotin transport system permease protein
MMRAICHPGETPLHRASAGWKLGVLAVAACVVSIGGWHAAVAGLLTLAVAWWLAQFTAKMAFDTLRPLALILAVIFLFQAVIASVPAGALIVTKLVILVLTATLVSLTTKVADMLAVLENLLRPFARFGVNAEHVSFLVVLAIRFLPALARIVTEVREAQRARGLERQFVAAAVPTLIRTLREADAVAEALAARGWQSP